MMRNRPDPARLFRRPMGAAWWLSRRAYVLFIVRELTSVFIAAFLVELMVQLYLLGEGLGGYAEFMARLAAPGWMIFHAVVLFFAVWHSLTWFYTTSIVIPVKIGGKEAPRAAFTAFNIVVWLATSAVILFLFVTL